MLRELLRRIHYLVNRRRFDDELKEEMAFHREMAESGGGVPLGNALRLREESREAWGFMWLDRLGQDLRYAFRAMRSSPGFTISAVLVLSIGIGATVAAFSAFNNVAFRSLPVRDPQTILRFERQSKDHTATAIPFPAVAFYREHSRTLSAVLAQTSSDLTVGDSDDVARAQFVTSNFFDELGGTAAHGRLLNPNDGRPEAAPVVVLGYAFWVNRFGASPAVVGTSLRVNGKPVTIAGVAARDFPGLRPEEPSIWAPLEQHAYFVHGSQLLTAFTAANGGVTMWGRLGRGSSALAAEAELTSLAADLRRQHPDDIWEGERLVSEPGGYPSELLGATAAFAVVGTLALLILVVACGNLGSLLLSRGASRQREILLRSAIGAGTGRLIRQLFTESLALASLGCAGGLLLGSFVFRTLLTWSGGPPWFDPTPDWRVMTFAAAIGFASAVFFGLAPAVHVARQKTQKRNTTVARSLLIGAQVASSCVLLIVGGLLVRAFDRAASKDPGFDYEHVIVVDPSLMEHGYTAERARTYVKDLGEQLRGIPGVEAVAVTTTPPLGGKKIMAAGAVDGRRLTVYIHQVDPPYLATMKIPLAAGRNLSLEDPDAVVVSESLASRYWPGGNPLGQPLPIKIGKDSLTVVGVARDARSLRPGDVDAVDMYRLARDADFTEMAIVARTTGPSAPLVPAVTAAANRVDPDFKPRVSLMKDAFEGHIRDIEQSALAVTVLGFVALAVACLGVVGIVAYAVAARTKEIGIRMALGARPRDVVGSLVRQFIATIAGGLLFGVFGAYGLAQSFRSQMYGVSTLDPAAYIGAVALFLVAIALAALWPARRALRIDPLAALRND